MKNFSEGSGALGSLGTSGGAVDEARAILAFEATNPSFGEKMLFRTGIALQNSTAETFGTRGLGAWGNYRGRGVSFSSRGLVKTGTQWSKHSLQRLSERGVTMAMAKTAINKGQKFYDPLNKSINYVLPRSYASGKSLLVGTNPLTGEVTTVIRSSKNLINKRFIPIK